MHPLESPQVSIHSLLSPKTGPHGRDWVLVPHKVSGAPVVQVSHLPAFLEGKRLGSPLPNMDEDVQISTPELNPLEFEEGGPRVGLDEGQPSQEFSEDPRHIESHRSYPRVQSLGETHPR